LVVCAYWAPTHTWGNDLTHNVTLYAGGRFGGDFQDPDTDATVRLRDGTAYAVALDWDLDAARQLQIYASRSNTALALDTGAGSTVASGDLPLHVTRVHIGGTYFFNDLDEPGGRVGEKAYIVGGIGVSHLDPGLDGLSTELRPSMNVGFGWAHPLSTHWALRFEIRGHWTLLKGSGSLFCSGGCTLRISGDALNEAEILLGVSARF